jgi:hypothetical protein
VAGDVFKLTQGEGPDWARITELGRGLDPENALYQPGGRPGGEVAQPAPQAALLCEHGTRRDGCRCGCCTAF